MERIEHKTRTVPPVTASVLVRLRLIGQMEAWTADGGNILPTGRKTRGLLAIVALSAPRPVLRGKLAEMLWSRRPEEQARASLRQEIHRLNDALAPYDKQILSVHRDHLSLVPGTVWVDVEELTRSSAPRPATLNLFDGELLEGLDGIDPAFDNWLAAERERLSDRARALADAMLREQTEPGDILAAAHQLLRIDRTHEGAWRAMMRAYLAAGERGMALQAYERCRAVLADQLDARPSAETQRLAAEIRNEPAAPRVPEIALQVAPVSRIAPRPPARLGIRTMAEASSRPSAVPQGEVAADTEEPGEPQPQRSAMALGGPRIGVLPLTLLGMPETEAHLAAGIVDSITADLAKFRWLALTSSTGLAQFARQTGDEDAIRRAFNLDYMVDGFAQRDGGRLRVSLRVVDLRGGNQVICNDRFLARDGTLLDVQDDVSSMVAARTEPAIMAAEMERLASFVGPEAQAYRLMLRGVQLTGQPERAAYDEAGPALRQAVELAPGSSAAHAWLAWWHLLMAAQGWAQGNEAECVTLAKRAVSLDGRDARAVTILGHVRAFLQHRAQEALTLHEHALSLNPNLSLAWALSGMAAAYLGEHEDAWRRLDRAKQLSPHDPQGFAVDGARVLVAMLRGDHDTAIELGRAVASGGGLRPAKVHYLAALGHAGHAEEARAVLSDVEECFPGLTVEKFLAASPLHREADRTGVANGLRRAGLPD
jgi:DNA-binding SARP family transcriptional activator/TolB-like protein